jgi:hypothetical protein
LFIPQLGSHPQPDHQTTVAIAKKQALDKGTNKDDIVFWHNKKRSHEN